MAGSGCGGSPDRVDAELLSELVQLLGANGFLWADLGRRHEGDFICATGSRVGICGRPSYPIATIRSIGIRARSAISAGTLTSNFISRNASRSFGRVIIFMYLQ